MAGVGASAIALWLFFVGCWGVNAYKFVGCDFEAPYKGEIIHGAGLLGPISAVTVWFDDK